MGRTKPGWKTSEFWALASVSLAAVGLAILVQGSIVPSVAIVSSALTTIAYMGLRRLAKSDTGEVQDGRE